jgi:hypothetical protein
MISKAGDGMGGSGGTDPVKFLVFRSTYSVLLDEGRSWGLQRFEGAAKVKGEKWISSTARLPLLEPFGSK